MANVSSDWNGVLPTPSPPTGQAPRYAGPSTPPAGAPVDSPGFRDDGCATAHAIIEALRRAPLKSRSFGLLERVLRITDLAAPRWAPLWDYLVRGWRLEHGSWPHERIAWYFLNRLIEAEDCRAPATALLREFPWVEFFSKPGRDTSGLLDAAIERENYELARALAARGYVRVFPELLNDVVKHSLEWRPTHEVLFRDLVRQGFPLSAWAPKAIVSSKAENPFLQILIDLCPFYVDVLRELPCAPWARAVLARYTTPGWACAPQGLDWGRRYYYCGAQGVRSAVASLLRDATSAPPDWEPDCCAHVVFGANIALRGEGLAALQLRRAAALFRALRGRRGALAEMLSELLRDGGIDEAAAASLEPPPCGAWESANFEAFCASQPLHAKAVPVLVPARGRALFTSADGFLGTCDGDLGTCDGDLGTCDGDLGPLEDCEGRGSFGSCSDSGSFGADFYGGSADTEAAGCSESKQWEDPAVSASEDTLYWDSLFAQALSDEQPFCDGPSGCCATGLGGYTHSLVCSAASLDDAMKVLCNTAEKGFNPLCCWHILDWLLARLEGRGRPNVELAREIYGWLAFKQEELACRLREFLLVHGDLAQFAWMLEVAIRSDDVPSALSLLQCPHWERFVAERGACLVDPYSADAHPKRLLNQAMQGPREVARLMLQTVDSSRCICTRPAPSGLCTCNLHNQYFVEGRGLSAEASRELLRLGYLPGPRFPEIVARSPDGAPFLEALLEFEAVPPESIRSLQGVQGPYWLRPILEEGLAQPPRWSANRRAWASAVARAFPATVRVTSVEGASAGAESVPGRGILGEVGWCVICVSPKVKWNEPMTIRLPRYDEEGFEVDPPEPPRPPFDIAFDVNPVPWQGSELREVSITVHWLVPGIFHGNGFGVDPVWGLFRHPYKDPVIQPNFERYSGIMSERRAELLYREVCRAALQSSRPITILRGLGATFVLPEIFLATVSRGAGGFPLLGHRFGLRLLELASLRSNIPAEKGARACPEGTVAFRAVPVASSRSNIPAEKGGGEGADALRAYLDRALDRFETAPWFVENMCPPPRRGAAPGAPPEDAYDPFAGRYLVYVAPLTWEVVGAAAAARFGPALRFREPSTIEFRGDFRTCVEAAVDLEVWLEGFCGRMAPAAPLAEHRDQTVVIRDSTSAEGRKVLLRVYKAGFPDVCSSALETALGAARAARLHFEGVRLGSNCGLYQLVELEGPPGCGAIDASIETLLRLSRRRSISPSEARANLATAFCSFLPR